MDDPPGGKETLHVASPMAVTRLATLCFLELTRGVCTTLVKRSEAAEGPRRSLYGHGTRVLVTLVAPHSPHDLPLCARNS